jgi:glyoxylase-like metal-dependent hydrolase (beta-lactamase superfamily II)
VVGPPPTDWSVVPETAGARLLVPGLWRLRLPMAWEGIEHVNAYLIEAQDDGVVLVDCGTAGDPTCADALEAAMAATGHELEDVRALVLTHVHSDHMGLAALVLERSGAELWAHPDDTHFYDAMREPERIDAARRRRAWQEGVPDADLPDYGDVREETEGVLAPIEPDRPLHDGDRIGSWEVLETPGHAPSHISLVDRSRGVLILGDLLAPVFGPWYDYGYSPDPVGEFLRSLDRVAALGPLELALPGHGRALDHVPSIIEDHRGGVADRLEATLAALRLGPDGAYAITVRVFGELPPLTMVWRMTEIACYLRHLRLAGIVTRDEDADGRFRYVARSDIPIAR